MNLNISESDIQEFIKDSLLKAGIGKLVSESINKHLVRIHNNPIDKALKNYVAEIACELVREKFAEQIKSAVTKAIEVRVTEELVSNVVDESVEKMERAAMGRSY